MENISKALLIVGGILISLLIIGALLAVRGQWAKYQDKKDESNENEQIAKFNLRFEAYNSVIQGTKMISLANLAKEMNQKYEQTQGYTDVKIYARLMNTFGQFPVLHPSPTKTHNGDPKKYCDMGPYLEDVQKADWFKDAKSSEYKDFFGGFKSAYFKCVDIVYDKNTTRVCEMYFNEVRSEDDVVNTTP